MQLFLVGSLPLLFGFVALLPWGRHAPRPLALVSTFFKGVLVFFPGYLVILIIRAIAGFSSDGFLLYLSLLARDHWAPLLTGVGAFLLMHRFLDINDTDEGVFVTVFSFFCGYLAMVNVTDFIRGWGQWTAYDLFLLPVLRIAGLLLTSVSARRFFRWEGRDAAFFAVVATLLAVLLALGSWLLRRGLPLLAGLGTAGAALAALVVFAMRFPRAVRG